MSLHDVTTEIVIALGATDRLVGTGDPVDLRAADRAAIAAVPRVGGLESILAAHPDVVLGTAVVEQQDPELVAGLEQAGIAVYLADPATLEDVFGIVQVVATRAGVAPAGEALVARLRADAREDAATGTTAPTAALRVFVYDCCDPPFTAGGGAVLTDLVRRAGGRNVFADLDADWTHVAWEAVVARRPQLVVIHDYQYGGQGDAADKTAALRAVPGLAAVPVVVMPLGCSLGGLRSIEGLARLRAAIRGPS